VYPSSPAALRTCRHWWPAEFRHITGWQALEDVEQAAARQAAARALDEAVRAALVAGASWADIGRVTGMTRRSATERWSARG
jgi:hypothetical protein